MSEPRENQRWQSDRYVAPESRYELSTSPWQKPSFRSGLSYRKDGGNHQLYATVQPTNVDFQVHRNGNLHYYGKASNGHAQTNISSGGKYTMTISNQAGQAQSSCSLRNF